ncbi:MAG TPA: CPBP family glutamic-type intramembrane protease, partial [Chroococcales cyanobacterium]
MARSDYAILTAKELIEITRDLRTLLLVCTVSIILCPLCILMVTGTQGQLHANETAHAVVSVQGNAGKLSVFLKKDPKLEVRSIAEKTPDLELRSKRADVVLKVPYGFPKWLASTTSQPPITVYADQKRPQSASSLSRVSERLSDFQEKNLQARVDRYKIPDVWRPFVAPKYTSLKNDETESQYMLAMVLPFYLILAIGTAIFSTAIHLFAGEAESKTLITLFLTPVKASTILYSKFTAVVVMGILVAALAGASIWLALATLPQADRLPVCSLSTLMPIYFLLCLPAVVLIAALAVLAASRARNLQQAQTYSTVNLIVLLCLCGLAGIKSLTLNSVAVAFPVTNIALSMREAMLGNIEPRLLYMASGITFFYAALIVWWARRQFKFAEPALAESTFEQGLTREEPTLGHLAIFLCIDFLLMFYIGRYALKWDELYGNAVEQLLVILLPSLIFLNGLHLKKQQIRDLFKCANFNFPQLIGALSLAPLTVIGAAFLVEWQGHLIPMSGDVKSLISDEDIGEGQPEWLIYLCIAFLPGICEELLFRGLVLSVLRKHLRAPTAVVASAVIFGIFHASIYRFAQSTLLGLVAGTLTVLTGSIFPAMALHITHDALTVYGA